MKNLLPLNKTLKTLGIIAILILLSGITQAEDWPMFHHDLMHTGYTNESVKPPLVLLWKYNTSENIFSSPAVADEMIYVSFSNYIYALDAKTGDLKWKYKGDASFGWASPTVSEGIVYVGSTYGNYFYALDAKNGDLKWKYKTGKIASSPAVSDGIVYVGSDIVDSNDNYFYALDAKTGDLKWKYRSDRISSSPAVSDGIVYVGDDDGFYALDAKNGDLKWKYKTGAIDFSSPAVSEGIIYVGSDDSYVYALDAKTGDLKWKYKTDDQVWSSPAVAKGIVYICSDDDHVYALDARNGDLKWKYETYHDRCTVSSPSVSDGIVYVRTYSYDNGDFYFSALDVKNGELKWKYQTGYIEHSPAISGGLVYVCSLDGIIYAFANESASGVVPSIIPLSTPTPATIVTPTHTPTQVHLPIPPSNANIIWLSIVGIIALTLVFIGVFGVFKARRSEYEKRINEYRVKIEQWKREGYNVSELEEMLK